MIFGFTVNVTALPATPATVVSTDPEVAPAGTGTVILVLVQLVGVASVPLKVIVLVPCVAPKSVPLTVTESPTAPEAGLILVMCEATVKAKPLLARLSTVTTT
ncbi:MAG TPA: hypothetical protein VHH35_04235, partial [Pyrinomonadaceae bacterium]|nr:hypothetical protein [Pyrinomonadaceae bacterium]